ncbi:MAG: hypothetical protein ABH986_02805 [archaeon]
MKKGFIFSVMILLVGITFLNFSSFLKNNSLGARESMENYAMVNRVDYKYENIADNIFDIMINGTEIDINIGTDYIYFTEDLPDKRSQINFYTSLNKYVLFLQEHTDALDITINTQDMNKIVIGPYDINFFHASAPGRGNRTNNTIEYAPASLDFNSYLVDITLQNQTFNGIYIENNSCMSPGDPNGFCLTLIVRNSVKVPEETVSYCNLDPNLSCEIVVETSGEAEKDVHIFIEPFAKMILLNNNSVQVEIKSGIDFGSTGITPYIKFPEGFIRIMDYTTGIEKR